MNHHFIYNVILNVFGIILISVILFADRDLKKTNHSQRTFLMVTISILVIMVTDIFTWLFDGVKAPGVKILLVLLYLVYNIGLLAFYWSWLLFVHFRSFHDTKKTIKCALPFAIPAIIGACLFFINLKTGWFYKFDETNRYMRSEYFIVTIPFYLFYIIGGLLTATIALFKTKDILRRRRLFLMLLYMFIPIPGFLLQFFNYTIASVWPSSALMLVMLYINVKQNDVVEQQFATAKLQNEITDTRISTMLSQIQPHFLYNCLNTIDALCDVDTKAAQQAVRCFAKYLRGNMDALSKKAPIPFRDELSHLQQYLTLETFRFDNIQVSYDLETLDFFIPTLTLQVIVENAIKHGILKRENGGNITISSRDKGEYVQLTVEDDGVGFDTTAKLNDDKTHVGISNVKSRLESVCGGTLTIDSNPNVGTIVTFILPKRGKQTCE